jgi:hypothetical protein
MQHKLWWLINCSVHCSLRGPCCTVRINITLINFRGPCLKPLLRNNLTSSHSVYSYQRDERAKPGNLLTKRSSLLPSLHSIMSHIYPRTFHFHFLFYYSFYLSLSLSLAPSREAAILFCLPDCSLEIRVHPEGPATGHLDRSYFGFLCL